MAEQGSASPSPIANPIESETDRRQIQVASGTGFGCVRRQKPSDYEHATTESQAEEGDTPAYRGHPSAISESTQTELCPQAMHEDLGPLGALPTLKNSARNPGRRDFSADTATGGRGINCLAKPDPSRLLGPIHFYSHHFQIPTAKPTTVKPHAIQRRPPTGPAFRSMKPVLFTPDQVREQ